MKRILSGGEFEAKIGYCRAVVAGGFVHVAGTVGQGDSVEDQCQSALDIIEKALIEAGTDFAHTVRWVDNKIVRAEFVGLGLAHA